MVVCYKLEGKKFNSDGKQMTGKLQIYTTGQLLRTDHKLQCSNVA